MSKNKSFWHRSGGLAKWFVFGVAHDASAMGFWHAWVAPLAAWASPNKETQLDEMVLHSDVLRVKFMISSPRPQRFRRIFLNWLPDAAESLSERKSMTKCIPQLFDYIVPVRRLVCVFMILSLSLSGQSGPTLVGAGYSSSFPSVAPGQVVRLQVTGLRTVLSPDTQQATSLPLPTTFAGISVIIEQSVRQSIMGTPTQVSYKAAILSVSQMNRCSTAATADCLITYITAQMPYQMAVQLPVRPPIVDTRIVISENGMESKAFTSGSASDHIHVVTTCDNQTAPPPCRSIVAHADGTPVSPDSPAKPDETVVVYAWGLGETLGFGRTGEATPMNTHPARLRPRIRFEFSPNASASAYFPTVALVDAYLTPGFVGLYQVNIQLPATFPAVPPCGQGVQSNLTINLGSPFSFDGAAICVATE